MSQKTIILECIKQIIEICYLNKTTISNRDLLEICKPIGQIQTGTINPHLPHEIAETALNYLIRDSLAIEALTTSHPCDYYLELIKPLASRLPTQTWRSIEQNNWQQFSTPPGIGYLLAYLLNLNSDEEVLEPSAGTGSLAVWASGFGAETHTNEIDERRRSLLDCLDFKPTDYNAEYIHDYLQSSITPNCLIMNPPFSSNGGRTKNNSSKFGFRHIRSALERLKPTGKFGIILGNSAGLDTQTGRKFWQAMSSQINVKVIIKLDGREYRKFGTSVDVNLVIGTKYQKVQEKGYKAAIRSITNTSVESCEEGFALVEKLNLRLN